MIERIDLIRRPDAREHVEPDIERIVIEMPWKRYGRGQVGRIGGKAWEPADILPVSLQGLFGFGAPTAVETVGQDGGIHRARTGAADAGDVELRLFEQPIQNAPGEGAMRAATLQRNRDAAGFGCRCARGLWRRRAVRSVVMWLHS